MPLILSLVLWMLLANPTFADIINLKSGQSVNGKIIQKDAKSVTVVVSGMTMTYYTDEIKDINGQALVSSVQKPAVEESKILVSTAKVPLPGDSSGEKKELILKFIDVFGTRKVMAQNFEVMINNVSVEKPDVAQKLRERVKVGEIIERLIPLYDKHFTSEELKTYIDFYSSSVGQKLIINIGSVMKESIQVSADYIKEKFPEVEGGK